MGSSNTQGFPITMACTVREPPYHRQDERSWRYHGPVVLSMQVQSGDSQPFVSQLQGLTMDHWKTI